MPSARDVLLWSAFHEGGHVVAAVSLGILFEEAHILPGHGTTGMVSGCRFPDGDTRDLFARERDSILVCLSGPAAEELLRGGPWLFPDGTPDAHQALARAKRFCPGPAAANAVLQQLLNRARALVKWERRGCLDALAEALLLHKRLTGEQCRRICQDAGWR